MGLLMFLFIWASFIHVAECSKFCDPGPASCANITLPGGRSIQLVPRLVSTPNNSDSILGKLVASGRHFMCTLPVTHEAQTDASPSQEILGLGSSTTRSPETTLKSSTSTETTIESTTDNSPETTTESTTDNSSETTTGSTTDNSSETTKGSTTDNSPETTTESTTDNSPESTTVTTTDNSPETTTESTTDNSPESTTVTTTDNLPETTTESTTETTNVSSCKMLYSMGYQTSGVYSIIPSGGDAIDVYCDMISDGGGWTVFQKRYDGSVNFYRNYAEYVQGFGDVSGEYWLGLDIIYLLAKDGVELRIDMVEYSNNQVYAHYGHFSIGSPITNYQLTFSSYSGTAGEGLGVAKTQGFTTYDLDNDILTGGNCAFNYQGAWWYQRCYTSNLNGVHGIQNELRGIVWNYPTSKYMTSTEMKLRESS